MLRAMGLQPFVNVTAEELIFGYEDTLISLAHKFFPRHRRPMSRMGLLLGVSDSFQIQVLKNAKSYVEVVSGYP
jgi:hypothetical protein